MAFTLFNRENIILEKAQSVGDNEATTEGITFDELCREYAKLLKQAKRLVRHSDRNEEQLRRASEEILRQKQFLEKAQEEIIRREKLASLGQMVAGVAHELNTPIGIMLGAASSLGAETRELGDKINTNQLKKSDLSSYLESAELAAKLLETHAMSAARLVQSFKSVAMTNSLDEVKECPLATFLTDVIDSLRPSLNHRRTTINVIADEDLSILTRSGTLSQVLINLILNADLHAFDHQADPQITITATLQDQNTIALRVEDNGTGIPPDIAEKIFDPFFTTARHKGGSGLGLSIAHSMVNDSLGGTLTYAPADHGGSSFQLLLPRQAKDCEL